MINIPFGSAVNSAHVDGNQTFSGLGVIGTMGTSDVSGTALTLPIAVDAATGAQYSIQLGTANFTEVGTPPVRIATGTIGTILGVGGTVQVSGFSSGTNVNIVTGTMQNLGTVNYVGTIGTILGGTINTSGGGGGTNVNIVSGSLVGTILAGTLTNLVSGTFNAGTIVGNGGSIGAQGLAASATAAAGNPVGIGGTDSGGTIRFINVDSTGGVKVIGASAGTNIQLVNGTLTLGTIVGKDANGVAQTANPVSVGGTDSGGTIRTFSLDSSNNLKVNLAVALAGENTNNNWLETTPGVKGLRVKRVADWTASGTTTVWTPAAGKKFIITDIGLSTSAACNITIVDGNGGTDSVGGATTEGSRVKKYYFAANTIASEHNLGYYSLGTNNSLYAIASAGTGSLDILGYEI